MPWGDSNWQGDYPTEFSFGIRVRDYKGWYGELSFRHTSNVANGPPFNDEPETWLDAVMLTVGKEWRL